MNGTVKWLDKDRGYRFFGRQMAISLSTQFGLQLAAGDQVTFELALDQKSGRKAINVRAA